MNIASLMDFTEKISGAYARLCQPLLDSFGISRTSFDILLFLANNPQRYTAKDISTVRNIKPNVVSVHVDRLVNEGYLTRQSVREDRRKIRLVCTEKARPIISRGQNMQQVFYEDLISGLTGPEIETFRRCFQVIAGNADAMQSGNPSNLNGR